MDHTTLLATRPIILIPSFGSGLMTRITTMSPWETMRMIAARLQVECEAWAHRKGMAWDDAWRMR